jgi:transcriptional regulator GlxA family with amidase domain
VSTCNGRTITTEHRLAPLFDEIAAELDSEHSGASMPARAAMSERIFARRFRAEIG